VARIGGDEFVVLLPETDSEALEQALSRINEVLCMSEEKGGGPCVRLSAGGATAQEPGTIMEAYQQADEQMYRVKQLRRGRNRDR